jgi:hypothetical protein
LPMFLLLIPSLTVMMVISTEQTADVTIVHMNPDIHCMSILIPWNLKKLK